MNEIGTPEAQGLLLDVLMVVDEVCRKHGIDYWLDGGTLLGAVRSGGFIPWDDDADVCMSRSDFNRFLRVAPGELPENLQLLTRADGPLWVNAKVALQGVRTVDSYATAHGLEEDAALAVDVIVQDPSLPTAAGKWLSGVLRHTLGVHPWAKGMRRSSSLGSPVKKLRWWGISLIPNSVVHLLQRWMIRTSERSGDRRFLCYGYDTPASRVFYPSDAIQPTKPIEFAGAVLSAPANPSEYLTRLFGPDYLTPPPPAQQRSHFSLIYRTPPTSAGGGPTPRSDASSSADSGH